MPFIQVNLGAGRTAEQKRAMLDGIVRAVHETTDSPVETIRVWIVEVPPDEVMVGDRTLAERRAARAQ